MGKRLQFHHSRHGEFYPKQIQTHLALLNVHQTYTAILEKLVQPAETSQLY